MKRSNIDHDILFEDNHLIILNKRATDIVQGDKTGDVPVSELLKDYIKRKYHKPGEVFLGVVHRLDRPVSGALIFARTSKALTRLNEMLKNGEIRKTYWAVVKQRPPSETGHLVQYIARNTERNKSFVTQATVKGSQQAELIYKVIDQSQDYYLLEINLLTGRHHQIRVQLSAMGCPVRGDMKYGYPRSNDGGFIHLHARKLSFIHPVKKEAVNIIAPTPRDILWEFFAARNPSQPGIE